MSELKIRCSALGKIMTNSRKAGELSKTCRSYLEQLAWENVHGYTEEIYSKAIDKGIAVEDESIRLAQDVLDKGFMYKNETMYENDYLTGTPDVITSDNLVEIKSSWNAKTFIDKRYSKEIPDKAYYYQVMGYMVLTKKRKATLAYCLVDTPSDMVDDEIRRVHWAAKKIDEDEKLIAAVQHQHSFERVDPKNRVKAFIVKYDKDVVKAMYERIEECRKYYQTLVNELV